MIMAKYIHSINPNSEELKHYLLKLSKIPGTCIFVDIINSTADKYICKDLEWISKLNNTFNFITFLNHFPDYVVKGIGDELMLYLPEKEIRNSNIIKNHYTLLEEIHATIDNLRNHPLKHLFYECKVGVHFCSDVYNITFFEGVNDYYGTDIDIAARLMKKAKPNRIVISEKFYDKIREDINNMKIDESPGLLTKISKPLIENFKGVPDPVKFRIVEP